ncbi:MAG: hypothetical protein VX929_12020 [Pseudomonadota bacterium]|nr:hypothetical protein [Pseudomonadota bacterium]
MGSILIRRPKPNRRGFSLRLVPAGSIRQGRNPGSKLIEATISAPRQFIIVIAVASACIRAPPDAFNFSRRLDRDLEIELSRYLKSLE